MTASTRDQALNTLQLKKDYSKKPLGLKWRSNTLFILSVVAVGLFSDQFLYGIIVPILPFMLEDRIGVPKDQIQSHVDGLSAGYAGATVISAPFIGVLADKISSRQTPFLAGIAALLGATILLSVGQSVLVLYIARVLQGISGAVVWTLGLTLVLETVGPENLGKAIGSIFSAISIGTLCAPLLGGVLYEKTGYTGVFAVSAAVLVVDFVMRILVIEKKIADRYIKDDPDHDGGERQREDEQAEEEAPREANEEDPLLDNHADDEADFKLSENQNWLTRYVPILPCLADPRLLTALLVALIQATILGSFDATVPTVARELFDFDSLKAGTLFLPLALEMVLGPVFGWAVDKFGTKPVAVGGFAYLTVPLVLLRLPQAGGLDQIILYGGLLALCGLGLAAVGAPSIVEAGALLQKYYEVQPEFFGEQGPYAQLYSLNTMVFSIGLTVGPEIAGELKQLIGYGNMNIVLAGLCAITSLLCFIYIGGRPSIFRRKRKH